MPDHQKLYRERAAEYDRLVRCEDCEGNLLPTLAKIHPLEGAEVIEFGAGTGRLTRLLIPVVGRVYAFDLNLPMVRIAAGKVRRRGGADWGLGVADNRAMPVAGASADVAIEGWSFGYLPSWHRETWREEAGKAIGEMLRVLRPGGTAIMIETLGTGCDTPKPPAEYLADFYEYLEKERGFASTWIRTDFRFESMDEAKTLLGMFFGDDVVEGLPFEQKDDCVILPECTGIWWKTV